MFPYESGGGGRDELTYIKPRSTAPTEEAFILLVCLKFEKLLII